MQIEVITDIGKFKALRTEWNALLGKSGINNPFLRHEWLTSWWKGYGAGKKLCVVRFKDNGKTIGFAPLMQYKARLLGLPVETIGFISNHWTRMDFILTDGRRACLEQLLSLLFKTNCVAIFAQMEKTSENYVQIISILKEKGARYIETLKYHSFINLKDTWAGYLKEQSKNFRADFKKKLKRLQKIGEVSLSSQDSPCNRDLKEVQEVAQGSWQAKKGVNVITQEQGNAFYNVLVDEWQGKKDLDFSILKVGHQPVSYMVGVKNNGCYFAFDTAYKKDFDKYSPGMLMHNLLLEKLHNNGTQRFDFGYIADYKKHWTEDKTEMMDMTIFPNTVGGAILYYLRRMKNLSERGRK